jgi:hypothetical protein
MSDTESGIIVAPGKLVAETNGLRQWGAVFDALIVDPQTSNGKRIQILVKSEIVADFELSEQDAKHLAALVFDASIE